MLIVKREMPALWSHVSDVLKLEQTRFLPNDIASVVLRLLEMRNEIFHNASQRVSADYIPWPDPDEEHPTQCYQNWRLLRFPKKYNVRYVRKI